MSDVRLNAAAEAMLRSGEPPLIGLLSFLLAWIETRHLELMAAAGYDDVRRAHNSVFVHLRAGGMRLTDLADAAGMSKQAMGELVDDLVDKHYLRKAPDPTDGRAKLIHWAERGMASHETTMRVFSAIEDEISDMVGSDHVARLRLVLSRFVAAAAG